LAPLQHVIPRYDKWRSFQLLLIGPLPVDLFTTNNNNKLRHSTKMANEEQDEATFLYISFVMSMVMAQTRCTVAHSPWRCLFLSDGGDNNSNIVSFDFWVTTPGKKSRACAERKVQFNVYKHVKCDYQPSYIGVLIRLRVTRSSPIFSQTKS